MGRSDFLGRHAEIRWHGERPAVVLHDPVLTVKSAACELAPTAVDLVLSALADVRAFSLLSRHGARLSAIPMSTGMVLSVENFPIVIDWLAEAGDLKSLSTALAGTPPLHAGPAPTECDGSHAGIRVRLAAQRSEGGNHRVVDPVTGTSATLLPETGDIVVRDRKGRTHFWPHATLPDVEWHDPGKPDVEAHVFTELCLLPTEVKA